MQWLVLLLRQELQLCSIILEYCKIITAMRNNTIIDTVARSFENVPILFRQKTTVDIHWHIIFLPSFHKAVQLETHHFRSCIKRTAETEVIQIFIL